MRLPATRRAKLGALAALDPAAARGDDGQLGKLEESDMSRRRLVLLPLLASILAGCGTTTTSVARHEGLVAVTTAGWAIFTTDADLVEENERQLKAVCAQIPPPIDNQQKTMGAAVPPEVAGLLVKPLFKTVEKILFDQRMVSWLGPCPKRE